MFRFVFFIIAIKISVCLCDVEIVGGIDAKEGEFKFIVSLKRNGHHHCGATILNKNYILTAAHCLCYDSYPQNASYSIQYGSVNISQKIKNKRSIQVSKIICALYSSTILIWDVAVAKLAQSLPENDPSWAPVSLGVNFNFDLNHDGGIILGWGQTIPNKKNSMSKILQKLKVQIYNKSICAKYPYYRTPHHVCVGTYNHKTGGICEGDSGSPLLINNNTQIGIAAFISAKCGVSNSKFPNFYSRIDTYYNWILNNTESGSDIIVINNIAIAFITTLSTLLLNSSWNDF